MRIGLYLDINSIGSKYIDVIYKEAVSCGDIVIKNAYGTALTGPVYRKILVKCAFNTEETTSGYKGRIPMKLVKDMITAAAEGSVDTIMLATLDDYITPIISYIKQLGVKVILFVSCAGCTELINASTKSLYIEALSGQAIQKHITPVENIVNAIYEISSVNKGRGDALTAKELYENLCRLYHDFDTRNYGYTHFEAFIKNEVPGIYTTNINNTLYVNMVDNLEEVESFIYNYIAQKGNVLDDMQEIYDALENEFDNFSTTHYGYNNEYAFILSLPKLEINGNKGVKLKQSFKLK